MLNLICISEISLNSDVVDVELQQPDYVLFRRDRNINDYKEGLVKSL